MILKLNLLNLSYKYLKQTINTTTIKTALKTNESH